MRKMMAAAVAAMMVCVAQAVTVNWANKTDDLHGKVYSLDSSYTGSFSIAVVFNLNELPSTQTANNILKLMGNQTSFGMGVGLSSGANYPWGSQTSSGGDPTFWSPLRGTPAKVGNFQEGENVIGIVIRKGEDSGINGLLVDFYANGVLLSGNTTGVKWTDSHGGDTYTSVTIGDLVTDDAAFYFSEGAATAADFALLPEPTALALLALGVAGLALRRRVA